MQKIRPFTVIPSLPPELEPLRGLAQNLWWCWSHDAILLFQRLDRELWELSDHNPVWVLGNIRQSRLDDLAADDGFLSHMNRVTEQFNEYFKSPTWFEKTCPDRSVEVAYFSAEYGLNESVPIYSGGLGVLSGDHIKSSSDLGIPLVAVGLLYRVGYLRQYLNLDGWQQELYQDNDFYNLPLEKVTDDQDRPVTIQVELLERAVTARVWRLMVGRVPLYLLDTNLEQNAEEDQQITAQLYGGDLEMRIKQEILLGIGGQRLLEVLGLEPTVCHMNEGHSAFQALERIHRLMVQRDLTFWQARVATSASNVFTTHTPVPAGNDMFPPALMDKYMSGYWPRLGLEREDFLGLGRIKPSDPHEPFCMTVLAIRLAANSNGVSRLHGDVSRRIWQGIWPEVPLDEIPIVHITNGIHLQSWVSRDVAALYDRYLGLNWRRPGAAISMKNGKNGLDKGGGVDGARRSEAERIWSRVDSVPDEELWRIHERLRARLVSFARNQLRQQLQRRGAPQTEIEEASHVLDPEALTIGFARRFATYKRATLLFRDPARIKRILERKDCPVQIIVAGKAHPRDNAGKELIRQIIHHARDPVLRRRVVFIEDYSMHLARRLVQGVDLWLNTPRRPMEASGTSGMKCASNGGLNLSTLDGWWAEGGRADNGWTIGKGEDYANPSLQDDVESHSLYDLLEKEVIPLYYTRTENDVPKGWIARMKSSIRTICPIYNTSRMVAEYTERFYIPAHGRTRSLTADSFVRARTLATWQEQIAESWPGLVIRSVAAPTGKDLVVNSALPVSAVLELGELRPEDLMVQLYYGSLDAQGNLQRGTTITMEDQASGSNGVYTYTGAIPCRTSGRFGFAVRILPRHPDLHTPFIPELIRWG